MKTYLSIGINEHEIYDKIKYKTKKEIAKKIYNDSMEEIYIVFLIGILSILCMVFSILWRR